MFFTKDRSDIIRGINELTKKQDELDKKLDELFEQTQRSKDEMMARIAATDENIKNALTDLNKSDEESEPVRIKR